MSSGAFLLNIFMANDDIESYSRVLRVSKYDGRIFFNIISDLITEFKYGHVSSNAYRAVDYNYQQGCFKRIFLMTLAQYENDMTLEDILFMLKNILYFTKIIFFHIPAHMAFRVIKDNLEFMEICQTSKMYSLMAIRCEGGVPILQFLYKYSDRDDVSNYL